MKLKRSYFLWYFCHIQICNDDCWVICMLWSNVKSLFYHVTIQYAKIKPIPSSRQPSSKRQERKEQEEKVAKLPKLDYFGFLTRPQLVARPRSPLRTTPLLAAVQQFSWEQHRCPQLFVSNHATGNRNTSVLYY